MTWPHGSINVLDEDGGSPQSVQHDVPWPVATPLASMVMAAVAVGKSRYWSGK